MNTPENPPQVAGNQTAINTGDTNKPTAKSKPKKSKTPMLNQAWIDETVRSYGLASGPLATLVGHELSTSLEEKLIKATSRDKITKLIRSAVATSIGKDLP